MMRSTVGVLRISPLRPDVGWRVAGVTVLAVLILLPRLLDLGTVLTVDEPLWRARAYHFLEGIATLTPSKTFQGGQPGMTTMWLAGLAAPFNALGASQAAMALGSSLTLGASLVLLSRLTSPLVAFAAGVVAALDPFVIAHSRVVHTDALLGHLMLFTILLLACAWRDGQRRYLAYASIATALAALTKLFGLFLLLPLAFTAIFAPVRDAAETDDEPRYRRTRRVRAAILVFVLSLVLAWPALLFSPRVPLAFMTQRVAAHSQEAAVGSGGGDTWYYPREFLRRLTPATTVLLPVALLGLAVGTGRRLPRLPGRLLLASLLGSSALFVLLLSLAEQKSDRYILFAHLSVDVAVGSALVWLAALVAQRRTQHPELGTPARAVLASLLLGTGGLLAREDIRIHPHYQATWNHLLPVPADVKYGWGEGLEEAAAYLRTQSTPPDELTVATQYPGVLAHFLAGRMERVTRYADPSFQYVLLYRSMFGRGPTAVETQTLQAFLATSPAEGDTVPVEGADFRLEKIIVINRIPYVWIFHRVR